jgi:hypothetical protein
MRFNRIYPTELEIKDTTYTDRSASYLELHLEIDSEGWFRTKLYDKRDDFNFPIVNFPFMVISHEWGKDREVFTTSRTYPWSFVTQIFHNGQPGHGGNRKRAHEVTSGFSGVRATRSLVLCVCIVARSLSLCTFSFVLSVLLKLSKWWLQLNREESLVQ